MCSEIRVQDGEGCRGWTLSGPGFSRKKPTHFTNHRVKIKKIWRNQTTLFQCRKCKWTSKKIVHKALSPSSISLCCRLRTSYNKTIKLNKNNLNYLENCKRQRIFCKIWNPIRHAVSPDCVIETTEWTRTTYRNTKINNIKTTRLTILNVRI